jgi:competence protein ComEC
MVSGDGRHVGIADAATGRLLVLRDTQSQFVRENLAESAGMSGEPRPLSEWQAARCNRDFCVAAVDRGGRVWRLLIARGRDMAPERSLAAACERSDLVIADRWLPSSCRPRWLRIDRSFLARSGGVTIDLAKGEIRTVAEGQGAHGWWREPEPRRPRPRPGATPRDQL